MSKETNNFLDTIQINKKKYAFFNLTKLIKNIGLDLKKLPFTYRVLLENLIRQKNCDKKVLENLFNLKYGKEIFLSLKSFNARLHWRFRLIFDLGAMRDRMAENKKTQS